MFTEMTSGSHHSLLISKKGAERNHRRQLRSDKIRYISRYRANDQRHGTCLFCLKEKMEQKTTKSLTDGKLRELTLKWFTETQLSLIVQNGFFPNWFLGFISREDAEEILRGKDLGCFLIRLSEKTIGYVLSYKGRDRCRHFVINQSESRQFVVSGDSRRHNTVSDLIEYFKRSPIEPFGEYLMTSCFEAVNDKVYDAIQVKPKEKPAAPKSNRTLEEAPPLPKRDRHLESGPLKAQETRVLYTQLRKKAARKVSRLGQDPFPGDRPTSQHLSRCCPPSGPPRSELLGCKSRSLPFLDRRCDGEQGFRLSSSPIKPPRRYPKAGQRATGYGPSTDGTNRASSRPVSSSSLDYLSCGAVYHLAGRPCSYTDAAQTRSLTSVYAEVLESASDRQNTYELVPDQEVTSESSKTYESLDDIRPKHKRSFWGLKNDKWKWLFPEFKKK